MCMATNGSITKVKKLGELMQLVQKTNKQKKTKSVSRALTPIKTQGCFNCRSVGLGQRSKGLAYTVQI